MLKNSGHNALQIIRIKHAILSRHGRSWGEKKKKSIFIVCLGSECSPLSPAVYDIQNVVTGSTLEKYTQVISKYSCPVFTRGAIKSFNCCAFTIAGLATGFQLSVDSSTRQRFCPRSGAYVAFSSLPLLISPPPAQPLAGSSDQPYLVLLSPCRLVQSQNLRPVSCPAVFL